MKDKKKTKNGKGKSGLTPKERLFCYYYAKSTQAFGNGTLAYALAFGKNIDEEMYEERLGIDYKDKNEIKVKTKKVRRVCSVMATRLLAKANIHDAIEKLLNDKIDHDIVDRELAKVIMQNKNQRAKVAAISEYNKVNGRITGKIKLKFEGQSDEALAERAAEIIAGIIGGDGGDRDEEEGE